MILTEMMDGLVKSYSDRGVYLLQLETGIEYSEAVDVVPNKYTYTETNTPIETEEISGEELLSMMEGIV